MGRSRSCSFEELSEEMSPDKGLPSGLFLLLFPVILEERICGEDDGRYCEGVWAFMLREARLKKKINIKVERRFDVDRIGKIKQTFVD